MDPVWIATVELEMVNLIQDELWIGLLGRPNLLLFR